MALQAPVLTQRIWGAYNPTTNLLVGIQTSGEAPYQNVPNELITPTFAGVHTATNAATNTVLTLGKTTQGDGGGATFVYNPTDTTSGCVCLGTAAGTVLTVASVTSGTIVAGYTLSSGTTGLPLATVTSFGTGAGGTGTYNLSAPVTQVALATFLLDNNSTTLVSADGSRWILQSGQLVIPNNTVMGNISGATAPAVALTQTQLTALINPFTALLSGDVPASGGGVVNFLRADGTWANPVATNTVTNAILAQAPALTVKCNPTNALANVQDLAASGANQMLQSNGAGTALIWSAVYTDAAAVAAVKVAMTNTGNVLTTGGVGVITLNTNNATAFSAATNGYTTLPNGIIIQWGTMVFNTTAAQAVTFPIAYPAHLFNIQLGMTSDLTGQDFVPRIKSGTQALSGFTIGMDGFGGTFDAPQSIYWFTVGN